MSSLLPKNFLARLMRFALRRPTPTTKDVKIGDHVIGRAQPCFFVAEIGINHNGSMEIAKQLIDGSVAAGAQAVKFQKRTVSVVYTADELAKSRKVDKDILKNAVKRGVLSSDAVARLEKSNYEDSTNGDLKWALEFTEAEYRELADYAIGKKLLCFASPWDEASVDVLEKIGVPCHKIASASLTDAGLLRKVKATGKPIILSTGMSTPEEIRRAIEILGTDKLVLLHTVSTYPSADGDLNLRAIPRLRSIYPTVPIGYSGHEKTITPSLAAAVYGAHLIERHVTLDRAMPGTDQAASLTIPEFTQLIKEIRTFESAVGSGEKTVLASEVPIREKLRRVNTI